MMLSRFKCGAMIDSCCLSVGNGRRYSCLSSTMATARFTERANDTLRDIGFIAEEDASIGEQVLDMKQKGFSCLSADGLDFLLRNFIDDERIKEILRHSFSSCGIARYRKFQSDPGHIFQFRRGGKRAPGVLVILLWGDDSEVAFFGSSHQHDLSGVSASNGLWEVPSAALELAGCNKRTSIPFKLGGLTIHDARVAIEFRKGQPIGCVFTTDDVMSRWSRIVLPNSLELSDKVEAIRRTGIGLHFQFEDPDTK
ncbi:hypothetical protein GGR55DRAFT_666218 [Xylaria sp. FL0064]|nr:hypothetical protein GGR55DRAFT_666218 [Xylaria sp. FL0064]